MANAEHLAILKQGGDQWNEWRKEHPGIVPDLAAADLRNADLSVVRPEQPISRWGVDLHGANLQCANLRHANLGMADLRLANLCDADLTEADLRQANSNRANLNGAKLLRAHLIGTMLGEAELQGADFLAANLTNAFLQGAVLREANLLFTNLNGARLAGADFTLAWVGGSVFVDVDLSEVIGLETIRHNELSPLGIETIYLSRGKIPEVFLRGCGVPDEFVAYIGSMVGRPIEYYSCFISYSSRDQEFAERLHADLQAKGVRCWFAPHDIHGGRKIHEQIDEAIRLHDKLLLILSEHSMASEWVKTELAKARKREVKEAKRVLFPVLLVTYEAMQSWEYIDSTGKDLAEEVRQCFIPDFSRWKEHDSYQAGLGRLVSDLKAQ